MKLTRFWAALEGLTGQAAVAAEWNALLGPEFGAARPLLRPCVRLATSLPRGGGGAPFAVVEHAAGDFVRVCPETGETAAVCQQDLVVFELDREALAGRVAKAFGLGRPAGGPRPSSRALLAGEYAFRAGERVAVYLTFPLEPEDMHAAVIDLAGGRESPFVLLAPTRRWLQPAAESALLACGSYFLTLDETVAAGEGGALRALEPLGVVLGRLRRRMAGRGAASDMPANELRRTGGGWRLTFAGRSEPLRNSVGLRYLARLIAARGQEVHVGDLLAAASGRPAGPLGDGDDLIDAEGMRRFRERYEDLRLAREEAKRNNDPGAAERAGEEMAALETQVSAAKGLGGRKRKVGGEVHKARKSVCNAIQRAIEQIAEVFPECGRHLDVAVSLGVRCSYRPRAETDWQV